MTLHCGEMDQYGSELKTEKAGPIIADYMCRCRYLNGMYCNCIQCKLLFSILTQAVTLTFKEVRSN